MAANAEGAWLLNLPTIVQRVLGLKVEWRSRADDGAWAWSEKKDDAFVFPMAAVPLVAGHDDFERSSAVHVRRLKDEGEAGFLCACVFEEQQRRARDLRRQARDLHLDATVRDEEGQGTAPVAPPAAGRKSGSIAQRIRTARLGRRRKAHRTVTPQEAYEMTAHYLGEGGGRVA